MSASRSVRRPNLSIDFRFGSYEDLERMEDLSERVKSGINKE